MPGMGDLQKDESGYKLINADADKYIIQHPDGSQFNVAKNGIDDATHSKINALSQGDQAANQMDSSQSSSLPKTESSVPTWGGTSDPTMAGQNAYKERLDFLNQSLPGLTPQDREKQAMEYGLQAKSILENQQKAATYYKASDQAAKKAEFDQTNAQRTALGLQPLIDTTDQSKLQASTEKVPSAVMTDNTKPAVMEQPAAGKKDEFGLLPEIYAQPFREEASAIRGMANTQSQKAAAESAQYADYAQKQQQLHDDTQKNLASLAQENQALTQKVSQGTVDPHRLWSSASTGNKILAGIGLILGGAGAGLAGGPNQALKMLQDNIDRDIEAQKVDLGKNQNLLAQNMQKYRDVRMAEDATRIQLSSILQGQIASTAAKYGDPMAQQQAQMAVAQLKQQQIPLGIQLANNMTQAKSLGVGTGQGGIPVGQEPTMLLSDPKYAGRRVEVSGKAYQAASEKEGEEMRKGEGAMKTITGLINDIDSLGPQAAIPGTPENRQAKVWSAAIAFKIPQTAGLTRVTETEIHQGQQEFNDPSKLASLLNGGVKNSAFLKYLGDQAESERQSRLIGYKGPSAYKTFTPMR